MDDEDEDNDEVMGKLCQPILRFGLFCTLIARYIITIVSNL
jgi:hypothetical protein